LSRRNRGDAGSFTEISVIAFWMIRGPAVVETMRMMFVAEPTWLT
jgi:hypothetical protein